MEPAIDRVRKLAEDGVFGEGELIQVAPESDDGKGAQYASQFCFLRVDLRNGSGKIAKVHIAVKTQVEDEEHRSHMVMDTQFANEVVMYEHILPKLGAIDLGMSPRMYYGVASSGKQPMQDILILNDLRQDGYKIAKEQFFNYDHVAFTMKKLGEFHGLSYKLKKSSPGVLKTLGDLLATVNYKGEQSTGTITRGFAPFLKDSPSYAHIHKVHDKLTSQTQDFLRNELKKPEEPFDVIMHGDVNRNNMLFKYDDRGKVVDLKFLDFGTAEHSDPSIDITFFLYMNTSQDLRAEHWDEFFKIYWTGVTSVAGDPGFTFDEFLRNFAKKAVYGFLPSSFFLPMMLVTFGEIQAMWDPTNMEATMENLGGERVTKVVTSIVGHLLDKGYLEEYVRHYNKPE